MKRGFCWWSLGVGVSACVFSWWCFLVVVLTASGVFWCWRLPLVLLWWWCYLLVVFSAGGFLWLFWLLFFGDVVFCWCCVEGCVSGGGVCWWYFLALVFSAGAVLVMVFSVGSAFRWSCFGRGVFCQRCFAAALLFIILSIIALVPLVCFSPALLPSSSSSTGRLFLNLNLRTKTFTTLPSWA